MQRIGTLKNDDLVFRFIIDKSKEEEYFLEICDLKGTSMRQIAVTDIESIDP